MIWKDEAFYAWLDQWAIIYGQSSPSYEYLNKLYNSFYLMNVVENDYINGDLNEVFREFFDKNSEYISTLQ
jgi:methylenetetrahydrofolate reductase (NADPH)